MLSRDSQLALGQPSTRSTWLHLYINGQYWGLYQTQERADADFAVSYFGGKAEDYDVIKPEAGPYTERCDRWQSDRLQRIVCCKPKLRAADGPRPNFVNHDAFLKAQGLNPDGSRNPNYKVLLDVII